MERETGLEPATSTLARLRSTTELFPLAVLNSTFLTIEQDWNPALQKSMVPEAGIEPARACTRGILSPLCLPVPPLRH